MVGDNAVLGAVEAEAAAIAVERQARLPLRAGARLRGVARIPTWLRCTENARFRLDEGSGFREDLIAKSRSFPALCRTLRPAPQAGCFVFWS